MGLVQKIKEKLVKDFIAGVLKDAAEGKYGERPKKVYWWIHDHATGIGLVTALLDLLLRWYAGHGCAQCPSYDGWLLLLDGLLVSLGLSVGLHASAAPTRE